MAIKFLNDHKVEDLAFKTGEVVEDRNPGSELHFVRRGYAAFLRDGKLYDHEDREVADIAPTKPTKALSGSRPARERRVAPRSVVKTNSAKPAKATAKKGVRKKVAKAAPKSKAAAKRGS